MLQYIYKGWHTKILHMLLIYWCIGRAHSARAWQIGRISGSAEQIGLRAGGGMSAGMHTERQAAGSSRRSAPAARGARWLGARLVPNTKNFGCHVNSLIRCREGFSDTN